MTTPSWFSYVLLSLCALLAPWAGAEERQDIQEFTPFFSSDNDVENFSSKLRGRSDFSNTGREWVANLEQAGIVNRSLRGPYRIAVPLMSFGHAGPKVMITYARKLPGASNKGVLLFIHIPMQ